MKVKNLFSKRNIFSFLENMFLLTLGAFLFSFGAECIAAKGGFLTGDIYGLGILVWQTTKTLTPAIWFFLFNVPLYILAWVSVGRVFFLYSVYGMVITTVFSSILNVDVGINNQFYAAVASGLICGAGIGIMLRSLGSGSGLDVVGMIVHRHWGIGIDLTHLYFNSLLFLGCLLFINVDIVLVSLIQVYLTSVAMEKVMSMFSQRKLVFIVSDKSRQIAKRITRRLGIGATFLSGRGAYSGESRDVIMTVSNNMQLKRLEQTVFNTDKRALFIVENSFAVRGHRDFVVNKSVVVPDFLKGENDEDPKLLDLEDAVASAMKAEMEADNSVSFSVLPENRESEKSSQEKIGVEQEEL